MREKLIELLSFFADGYSVENRHIGDGTKVCEIADHLIANGVTIQRWIPVSERLPEANTLCLYFTPYDGNREWDMGVVCFRNELIFASNTGGATHWMPLPQPPKEGE